MQIRKTSFLTYLASDIRRRHEHFRRGSRVLGFCVQLEIWTQNSWHPIVRYDTAHGFAHRDLLRPGGALDKTPLFLHSFNEALDFAEADLKANWKSYVDKYRKEIKK